ncbi:MAG TPA: hypothetical protein VN649_18630 [Ramlibacter sp.]|nr:hypothetical protein [Ramlibacter sp.]
MQINDLNAREIEYERLFSRRKWGAKYTGSMHLEPPQELTALKSSSCEVQRRWRFYTPGLDAWAPWHEAVKP